MIHLSTTESKKMDITKFQYTIPAWALSGIFDGDMSGLSDNEESQIDSFFEAISERVQNFSIDSNCNIVSHTFEVIVNSDNFGLSDFNCLASDTVKVFLVILSK